MTAPKDSSHNMPEQKKNAPHLKSVPETPAQKGKDKPTSHSQDADRHRRTPHTKSGK